MTGAQKAEGGGGLEIPGSSMAKHIFAFIVLSVRKVKQISNHIFGYTVSYDIIVRDT